MSTPTETYILPSDPRANACGAFFDELKTMRGKPLAIDASAVERMDALVAQVMLIGKKTWSADNVDFEITGPSENVRKALEKLGLQEVLLTQEAADVD